MRPAPRRASFMGRGYTGSAPGELDLAWAQEQLGLPTASAPLGKGHRRKGPRGPHLEAGAHPARRGTCGAARIPRSALSRKDSVLNGVRLAQELPIPLDLKL